MLLSRRGSLKLYVSGIFETVTKSVLGIVDIFVNCEGISNTKGRKVARKKSDCEFGQLESYTYRVLEINVWVGMCSNKARKKLPFFA